MVCTPHSLTQQSRGMPKAALWVFKRFWPPALAQQAPQAINPAALCRFRGAASFRGLAPVFKPGRAF